MSVSTSSRCLMVQAQAASGGERRRRRRRPLLLRGSGQVGATSRRIVRRVLERNIEERYRAGNIGTEEALHLFDELLHVAGPSLTRAINCLLYVVGLFNRVARAKVPPTMSPTAYSSAAAAMRAGEQDQLCNGHRTPVNARV
ncbi:uncharacterized protein [Triticum aestivum]|uniref:uncharacterized protein n=1 Tax=Triticum aestivum TaxID=4565 RepID=UPI001D035D49|nr:uncharacterized protein LOC123133668 [Triticum aestivum]